MARREGIRVHLRDPEETVDYPDATNAFVAPDGQLIVVGSRPDGFPVALDRVPAGRWRFWAPWSEADPDTPES